MAQPSPLTFYDISSPLRPRSYAPNPSKTRYALSLKATPFITKWIDILSIPSVRQSLSCPATRSLSDGSDYHTLPILYDPNTETVIGDSFDIANYLEDHYPDSGGCLFPETSTRTGLDYESPNKDAAFFAPLTSNAGKKNEDYARFNGQVDTTFSAHVVLVSQYMPFNPDTAEEVKAMMAKRAHLASWDDVCISGTAREEVRARFKGALESLAELFMVNEEGPYLEGVEPNYADLIVGGWVNFWGATLPQEEWRDFRTWYGGVFGRLHDALQKDHYKCQ